MLILNKLRVKCSKESFRTFVHIIRIAQINDEFNLTVQQFGALASDPDNSLQYLHYENENETFNPINKALEWNNQSFIHYFFRLLNLWLTAVATFGF